MAPVEFKVLQRAAIIIISFHRTVIKMARIRGAILKWFISVSLVLCMTHRSAGEESSEAIRTLPDIEQIKNDFIYINKFAIENLPLNNEDQTCLSELNAIGNGIQHLEFWAMKSNVDFLFFFKKT